MTAAVFHRCSEKNVSRFRIASLQDASHLGDILPDALTGEPQGLWFSLMQERVVYDGAWVSVNPTDGSIGFPLSVHGTRMDAAGKPVEKWGAVMELSFKRGTIKSTDLASSIGSYGADALQKGTLYVWKSWESNTVISIDFEKLEIEKATSASAK